MVDYCTYCRNQGRKYCAPKEAKVSNSASVRGSMALYWIDFKHERHQEEVRLQVEAENIEEAKKKARAYVSKRFKIKEACCVR